MPIKRLALLAALAFSLHAIAQSTTYRYIRLGNATDASAAYRPGFALMGGGDDLDEAFRFLCDRSGSGDFLILRSHGGDNYNPYVQKLCHQNSVATLIIPSRAAAEDPFVARTIAHASALFIAGGDQGEYITFWKNTPVQAELNRAIVRGVPIGGTSAGLVVLGQFIYTSLGDKPDGPNLDGKTAMALPFGPRIALDQDFLDIPLLKNVITDTHFAKRNRMGRMLVFLARIHQESSPTICGIAIDERSAVLVEPTGEARIIGPGRGAWFIGSSTASGALAANAPFTFGPYSVQKVVPGHAFNLKTWSGDTIHYELTAQTSKIQSTQPGGSVY
ncbi:MAG TPA: cyanophycinase [Terracidiphilus sp.]|nr:cyanophycinase [Terracidiphilus sp.]